jgi:D-alanine-D-alanine ligase
LLKTKINIAVFIGGTSPEREVSKSSGKAIFQAVKSLGHKCTLIDPAYGTDQPDTDELFFAKENFSEIKNENLIKAVNSELLNDIELVFLALHGKWGEDGVIQSLLKLRGIRYTGSGILSSAISMDKAVSKTIFLKNKINTPDWFTVESNYTLDEIIDNIKLKFGYPCVIKPNDQGSTVGLTIVEKDGDVKNSVEQALKFSEVALIEKYIKGREMTVAILEDKPLPVLEIIPQSGFYDYKSKYTSGMSEYIVPFPINCNNKRLMLLNRCDAKFTAE